MTQTERTRGRLIRRALVVGCIGYGLLWLANVLFAWGPASASTRFEIAALIGAVVLVLDVAEGVEALQDQVRWLETQLVRVRVEANRDAIEWVCNQEGDKFDPAHLAPYLEGWNEGLHTVTRTPSVPPPGAEEAV